MATVPHSFSPADIFQGPMDIWLDMAAPPSAVPLVPGVNTPTIDQATGVPTDTGDDGFNLGITEGPVTFSLAPTFQPIMADNFSAPIQTGLTQMEGSIGFAVKELDYARMPNYFAGLQTCTYFALPAGANAPASDFLQFGDMRSAAAREHTLLMIGPRRGKYWLYIFAYRAYLTSAFSIEWGRAKETIIKVEWGLLADPNRQPRDQVLQMGQTWPVGSQVQTSAVGG
jgi:hypothetical protein